MKRLLFIGFFLGMNCLLVSQNNEEFRATWIVDYHWLSPGNTIEQNKALTREILDNHKKANMSSVLWQVRRFGTVYYLSTIEPWGPGVDFQDPGYDPLAYAVEQAHERGLEFHAWFNTFESRYMYPGSPSEQHSDWICRDQSNIVMPADITWLSPGLQDVRDYLKNVAMEIVNNYDIDGLHLDFVRWNEHTNSLSSWELAQKNIQNQLPDGIVTEEQLRELADNASGRYLYDLDHPFSGGVPSGFSTWEEWWRWTVTEFVSSLHDSIQAVKPWVRLSPAALGRYNWGGWQGYGSVYQDAALWLNQGYIDQIVGMHYHWNTASAIYDVLEGGCPQCWSDFIQPAIQAGRLYSVGLFSDDFAIDNVFHRHKSIIDTIRSVSWADGVQFFSYGSWNDQQYWDDAKSLFFTSKSKIRATELIDNIPPGEPTINLVKLDSLNYQIDVTPPVTQENLWFAIYRSEDDVQDLDEDEIIEIYFGDTQFSYVDSFTGLQDFNGIYSYFATALDRYWNESVVSNIQISDSIPSFAPTVLSTFPVDGDTIPVNSNIEISFSKTMDINSFQNAISFNPPVSISQLNWSSDNKTVTVVISGDFEFATEYTLSVEATVTDVNGKNLDGNGDGVSGDPFMLSFSTLGEDLSGPQIIYSYPNLQGTEQSFTIDEVITFQFDEIVDENSITDTSMVLTKDGIEVSIDYILNNLNNQSVLSVQSMDPLENEQNYVLTISQEITDTLGNQMPGDVTLSFRTSAVHYTDITMIENFTFPGSWWQPDGSGSTVGIIVPNTIFGFTSSPVPPAPRPKKAALLGYEWDPTASDWLIREYLAGGSPRNVLFDTSYVLQCYVFGDGSNNEFRFALDDNVPQSGAINHEVSLWTTIDWVGWRIVEWQLNDPNSVGTWIGNGLLEEALRFDSFQLTHEPGDDISGRVYFDELRLVKKSTEPLQITFKDNRIPDQYQLYQNYPNPFNPTTTISFDIPESGLVNLKVYDMLGREVETLISEQLTPGRYEYQYDAISMASGVYIYRLSINNRHLTRRMLLLK